MTMTTLMNSQKRITERSPAVRPRLLLFLVFLCAGGFSCLAEETPAQPADGRASIIRPPYSLFALLMSLDLQTQDFVATGNAEFRSPQGNFFADDIHYNFEKNTGYLQGARGAVDPFHFRAETLTLDPRNLKHIQESTLTTCAKEHPHYALYARDFVVKPDNHYEARHVSLIFGGRRLFTIPRLAGNLKKDDTAVNKPPLLVGVTRLDGIYLATLYDYPLSSNAGLSLAARIGTKGVIRGDLSLYRKVGQGTLSLRVTEREDAQNRVEDSADEEILESLTVSRLPALQIVFNPIPLTGELQGFTVRMGASAGRFREEPTEVTENRAQLWATLRTPSYPLGPALLRAEVGAQQAFYQQSEHQVGIAQLTLESPPEADRYFSITYAYRGENGSTPLLFDRVVIPRELSSELELPIGNSTTWRIGLSNRMDLEQRRSRELGVMAIYRLDCLSYALSYDTVGQTFGVGFLLNAFGNFHKRVGSIRFTD